ncbi:hypothetical protein ACFVS9_28050 [Streptomyces sp. NPDC058008]|uniref:hypothetical protein n=1 Tax=Streptomyces sp. NPDC058008 TaxID=3346303 RepID=UPI0036EF62E6
MTRIPPIRRPDMEEATPMYLILLGAVGSLTLAGAAWWQLRRLQHAIRTERAAVRLTRAADHRDMDAFRARIRRLVAEQQAVEEAALVLADAEAIVTAELARTPHYPHHPHEGDPT